MKKILTLLILFLFVGLFLWRSNSHKSKTDNNLESNTLNSSLIKKTLSFSEKLDKEKYVVVKPANHKSSLPIECESQLTDLSVMSRDEYEAVVESRQSFVDFFEKKCVEQLKLNEEFQKIADRSDCKLSEKKLTKGCLTWLQVLKSYFIADLTVGKKYEEMTSQELAANFVKIFLNKNKIDKMEFLENIKLAKEIYVRNSNDPDVVEAVFGYLMLGKIEVQDHSADSEIDEILQKTQKDSFQIDRLTVFKDMMNNDYKNIKSALDKLNSVYSNEAELAYYYSAYYWKIGDKKMANFYIDKSISLSEGCEHCALDIYNEAKSKMNNANVSNDSIFALRIGLNFEGLYILIPTT